MTGPAAESFRGTLRPRRTSHERRGHFARLPAQHRRKRKRSARWLAGEDDLRGGQQLRGDHRSGAPDPPGDPPGPRAASRCAAAGDRLRGRYRARAACRRCPRWMGWSPNASKLRCTRAGIVPERGRVTVPSSHTRAFIAVQNGCDHACTFCVIPQGRGPSRSLTVAQVLREIERHAGRRPKWC